MNVKGGASFRTSVPSAYGTVDSIAGPQQSYDSKGNVRIQHREYLFDVLSTSNNYDIQNIVIANPTVKESFPWLSGMAGNFQKFCFEKLCLHFVTQSPTSSPGSVMIVPIYDVDQNIPQDKSQALTFQDTTRSPAWQECCSLLPKSRLCTQKEYFTKIVQDDLKLSIPAKIMIATSGASDSSPITGEMWIEYDVKLSCPQRDASGGFDFLSVAPSNRPHVFPVIQNSDNYLVPPSILGLGLSYSGTGISKLVSGRYNITLQTVTDGGDRVFDFVYGPGVTQVYGSGGLSSTQSINWVVIDVANDGLSDHYLNINDTTGEVATFNNTSVYLQITKIA